MYIKLYCFITVLRMSESAVPAVPAVPAPAVLDTMVKIIMAQTDMTHECVVSELERTNYDLKRVIREYMRGDNASSNDSATTVAGGGGGSAISTNQLRFSEIRNFMDKSAEAYYRRREMERIYNDVLERKKRQAEESKL